MTFATKPPFLAYDISTVFKEDLKNLSFIPRDVYIYNDHYRLGGITSFIPSRKHYIGYICLNDNQLLMYDGTPSSNPVLKKNSRNEILGEISLIFYFPLDECNHSENESKTPSKLRCVEKKEKTNSSRK